MTRSFRAIALCLVCFVVVSAPSLLASECLNYGGSSSFEFVEFDQQFEVRFRNPDLLKRIHHATRDGVLINPRNISRIAEEIAGRVGVTVFFTGPPNKEGYSVDPVSVDRVWRCDEPRGCLRSMIDDFGLSLKILENDVWMIGPEESQENSAAVVFAYPMTLRDVDSLSLAEIRALFRDLRVHLWENRSTRDFDFPESRRVGLGYFHHGTDPNEVIVLVTEGVSGEAGVTAHLEKVRFVDTPQGRSAECVWRAGELGYLATEFAEDVDGDGVADILMSAWDGGWRSRWDKIISGRTGEELAIFATEVVAVERSANGALPRISVKMVPDGQDLRVARLLEYNEETSSYEPVETEFDRRMKQKVADGVRLERETVGRLLEEGVAPSDVVAYVLHSMRPSEKIPTGVEIVRNQPYGCGLQVVFTGFYPGTPPKELDVTIAECPEVTLLMRHIPEGYLKLVREWYSRRSNPAQ